MNLHTIGIIIKREYFNKVKKKSFLITTLVVPILMAALCIVPIVLMMTSKDKTKTVAVVDQSGIVMEYLTDSKSITFADFSGVSVDSLKLQMKELSLDAVLSISELNVEEKTVNADLTSLKPLGMEVTENINNRINDAVENYRIQSYNIEGLGQIMKDVKANVRMHAYTMDDSGKETISEAGVYSIISMLLGLLLFLFITMFGGMVMTAVIEEKSSRVVEVLISSVKATELMFGKIIGVALVAITQFVLWIVFTGLIVGIALPIVGGDKLKQLQSADPTEIVNTMGMGEMMDSGMVNMPVGMDSELGVVLGTLQGLPIVKFVVVFILFFVLGYLLYASLYAAIGSAVENEGDSQQLQMPVTIPLMLAYFIAIYTFNAPDSPLAFWGSMIPFTSPIVMLARLPFGVPFWQLALSLGLLVLTCIGGAWVSAKIYKVGILMYGKKTTFKDLWKWLKLK